MAVNYRKYKNTDKSALNFFDLYLESKGQCLESTNMVIVLEPLVWRKCSSNDRGI